MRYAAILERHNSSFYHDANNNTLMKDHKIVLVPEGQSLEMDEGTIMRRWLHPYLGHEWHLAGFAELI